jgi:hypothetical protein
LLKKWRDLPGVSADCTEKFGEDFIADHVNENEKLKPEEMIGVRKMGKTDSTSIQ